MSTWLRKQLVGACPRLLRKQLVGAGLPAMQAAPGPVAGKPAPTQISAAAVVNFFRTP